MLPSFILGLNGCTADNRKQTLLDFSFSLSKKQKIVGSEEKENEKEVVPMEDDGWEAKDILSSVSVLVLPL